MTTMLNKVKTQEHSTYSYHYYTHSVFV